MQFASRLWMKLEDTFDLRGPVLSDHILDKFFSHFYKALMTESLERERSGERKEKYVLSCAADMIGRGSMDLTVAQKSTRHDCKIVFEAAFVPNVKLVLTDDNRFIDVICSRPSVRNLFWQVCLQDRS